MTRLEQIEFENEEKLNLALKKVLNGEDSYRSYEDKDQKVQRKKIISNHNLYLGNNFSININKAANGKCYLSINYFGFDDRMRMAKQKADFKNASDI